MRLAVPTLKRSNSKTTIASFGNANASTTSNDNETINDNDHDSMYRVDSMIFESVQIPRTTPPPAIRISLATTANSRDSVDSEATLWREPSIMSLPLQPSLPDAHDEKAPWSKPPPLIFGGITLQTNSTSTLGTYTADVERGDSSQKKSTLARTLFFLGFLFPLFWALGGSLIWRRTDYARSDLSTSSRIIRRFSTRKSHTTSTLPTTNVNVNSQGRYIQRIGQLQRQGAFASPYPNEKSSYSSPSTTTLSANASVSVHLPYADDTWAWACLWAFALFCVALSITLLALYASNLL